MRETVRAFARMTHSCRDDCVMYGAPDVWGTVYVWATCPIIRPTGAEQIDAVGAIEGFVADGLFIGQPQEFAQLLLHLANEADEAKPEL